jgi:hypothetical protein
MNRDRFKFRLWSEKLKRYYYEMRLTVDGDLVPSKWIEPDSIPDLGRIVILEQCTGVTDKNGRLIYEGDVLEVPEFFGGSVNMWVFWDDNSCRWNLEYSGKRSTAKDMTVLVPELGNASKIIGNIHKVDF